MNTVWSVVIEFARRCWQWLFTLTHTLRFRLMLWNAVTLLLTALIALFGLKMGVQYFLLREVDQKLEQDLRETNLAFTEPFFDFDDPSFAPLFDQLNRKAMGRVSEQWYCRFLDGELPRWKSINTPVPLPNLSESGVKNYEAETIGSFRVMQFHKKNLVPPLIIQAGISLTSLQEELDDFNLLVLLSLGGLLLISPWIGYWLAGRTTKSVGAVIRTASQLNPEQLQQRLPERGSGDELDQLAKTVNELLDRIAHHMQVRRDFLANAAHELRTPLAAIRSSVEVALTGQRSAEEYQELLGAVIDESGALENLVNHILLLAETEFDAGHQHAERIDLSQLLHKAVDMFGAVAEVKTIDFQAELSDNIEVFGERQHLRQVVNNLLDNAIKFTPEAGRVTVRLNRHDAERQAILEVEDTGIGISEKDLPFVFDRFFRADNARSREAVHKGTGLGLSICRAVTEAHRGQIQVRSQLGSGTTFRVTLPLADEAP